MEKASLPDELKARLRSFGISALYPPQAEALERGLLDRRNLMVATPTASGKTLIAMMAAYQHLRNGGKCIYLTPLRALASEKLEEFRRFFTELGGFTVAASTGDYDSSDPWLANYDVIIATNEKADSLIRHGAPWINDLTLVVADEIHLLGEPDRGPTLEMTLTRLMDALPQAQFLALSATARNADEISEWLDSELIEMEWRPVPLREGVFYGGEVEFVDDGIMEVEQLDYDPAIAIALKTVIEGGQAIIFAMTRKRAESYAEKAADALARRLDTLTEEDVRALGEAVHELAEQIEKSSFTERLARIISRGASFHHAGLGYQHRRVVEKLFRERKLKIIAATPTLAAGVNLPARTVIIPELWRYEIAQGMRQISVTEYKQFCGRAGRPGFDETGYAITIARREDDKRLIFEKYLLGKPERIWSRLGSEKHLRTHVLALVASNAVGSIDELKRFFSKTLFSFQYGSYGAYERIIQALNFLTRAGFIADSGETLVATRLGKRVSELYIDPLTAVKIIELTDHEPDKMNDITLLQVICSTPDIPQLSAVKVSEALLETFIEGNKDYLIDIPDPLDEPESYEEFMETMKLVYIMKAWIDEMSESEMYERFGVEPGDLAVLRERCSWISYAASQLTRILERTSYHRAFEVLTGRLEHGVRQELLLLTKLHGIGRVRARNLYDHGFKTLDDLRRASREELARIPTIGPKLADQIKSQLS